jgi:hypothetical protein
MDHSSNRDAESRARGRAQLSLAALIALVLAAGVAAAVVRGSREVWGTRIAAGASAPGNPLASSNGAVPIERTAGLVLEVAAVFLVLIFAGSIYGLLHGSARTVFGARHDRAWAILWRALGIGFLFWFISEESQLLRLDLQAEVQLGGMIAGWGPRYRAYQNLLPLCALLAMIGLLLGMGAGGFLDEPEPRRPRPAGFSAVLGAIAGVLVMAIPVFHGVIPYLVVIAIEAVHNAMHHRRVPGPSLSARLLEGGFQAGVSWIACVALAVVLARDFDRARRGIPWSTTRSGWHFRVGLLGIAAASGLSVGLYTVPAIHPELAEGLKQILSPAIVGMIVCGFGLFGAGMAARSVCPRQSGEKPHWMVRFSTIIRGIVLVLAVLWFLINAPGAPTLDPDIPRVFGLVNMVLSTISRMWGLFPDAFVAGLFSAFTLANVLWITIGLGLLLLLVELAIRPAGTVDAPFDRLVLDRAIAGRFAWLVAGLVVVALAALPTFFVAGMALLHLRMFGGTFWVYGWPR